MSKHTTSTSNLIGKRFKNSLNEWYEVIKLYDSSVPVISILPNKTVWYYVKFDGFPHDILASKVSILEGSVKNPFSPLVYNVGYFGFTKVNVPERTTRFKKIYDTWKDMMKRCYDSKRSNFSYQRYRVKVHSYWHSFANFYEWVNSKYSNYRIGYQLDKDILGDGRVYSERNCVFVPKYINNQLITIDKTMSLPQGVKYEYGVYKVNVGFNKNKIHCGSFKTLAEAFYAYKIIKEEQMIKAFKYALDNDHIPKWLYDTLISRGWTDDRLPEVASNIITADDLKMLPNKDEFIETNQYLKRSYEIVKSKTFRDQRKDRFIRNGKLNN